MITEKRIIKMMIEALPRCPVCGSNIGYEVVSVFKGAVKCKSCQTEWSSRDFFESERLENLTIRELPEGHRAFTCGKHILRKYEKYPIDFWRSLGKIGRYPISRDYQEYIWVSLMGLLAFLVAFIPRFLLINKTSVMTDEPLYVNAGRLYVQSLLRLNFSAEVWRVNAEHPPIAKLLIGASLYIFAPLLGWESTYNLYFSARLAPVTAGTLICVFIYLIGRKYYGDEASLLAAILTAFSPWLIYYSTLAILDIFATLFLSLTFLLLPLIKDVNRYLILVGVLSGLAVGSKGTAIAAFPGIGLYLLLKTLVGKSRKEEKSLRIILLQFLLISLEAAFTFFATWPWLWQKTLERIIWVIGFHLEHMASGHTTFYAGNVYTHVPQWVTIYILFIKTPILIFILSMFFLLFVATKIVSRRSIDETYLSIFSWLIGGILTISMFRIIIGDHYVVFLEPAIILSASIFVVNILKNLRDIKFRSNMLLTMRHALASLMIMESLIGLAVCWASPCGYANELIIHADRALLIIDTGFEDAAEYLIKHCSRGATIAVAYSTSLLEIELNRKSEFGFNLVDLNGLNDADYAVFPSIYTQRYGFPPVIDNWQLIHKVESGGTTLCYIFKQSSLKDEISKPVSA